MTEKAAEVDDDPSLPDDHAGENGAGDIQHGHDVALNNVATFSRPVV